jgi:hypothetical protein
MAEKIEKHILKWVKSGALDDTLWVSLGFSSRLETLDRLHVVCATAPDAQDAKLRMDAIYLERFDQAYSCYHGANSIEVNLGAAKFRLNAHGRKSLDFKEHLHLAVPNGLRGWKAALKVFGKMPKYKSGQVLRCVA